MLALVVVLIRVLIVVCGFRIGSGCLLVGCVYYFRGLVCVNVFSVFGLL